MKNRFKIILATTAILSVISTFLIDVTSFGRHWNHIWKVDLERMVLTLIIVAVTSLFLGLFLLRKKSYIQRLTFTIPIAAILFSTAILINMLMFEYGLFDEYNYFTAKRDIKNGKIQILTAGIIIEDKSEDFQQAEKAMRKKFGYSIVDIGLWSPGAERYNNVIEDYLEKRNGKGWRQKLNRKIDSIQPATR